MTAICGIYSPDDPSQAVIEHLEAMMAALGHRGSGTLTHVEEDSGLAIGHLYRPADGTTDPIPATRASQDGTLVGLDGVVFGAVSAGGEDGLASALRVARAYRHRPEAFPAGLDGAFGLALWDRPRRRLVLARDPLGARPLFFHHVPERRLLLFASEIKAFFAHPAFRRRLDRRGLQAFLTFGYVPAPLTVFEGTSKVFPGSRITFDREGRLSESSYWTLPAARPAPGRIDQFARELRSHVLRTVARHVDGAGRIGVLLSGGLDSTVVLASLSALGLPAPETFTLGFRTDASRPVLWEDVGWARRVARHFGASHKTTWIGPEHDPTPFLPVLFRLFDEPTLTPNAYSKYLLLRDAARNQTTFVLTGSNAGYLLHRIPADRLARIRRRIGPGADAGDVLLDLQNKFLPFEDQPALLGEDALDPRAVAREVVGRYAQDVRAEGDADLIDAIVLRMQGAEKGIAVQDRAAALAGVETRHPFFDARFLAFTSTIPPVFKGSEDESMGKRVLKLAFADLLPEGIADRPVVGYPSYYWTRGEVDELRRRLLSREGLERTGLFQPDAVARLLEEDARSTKKSAGKKTWGLLVAQAWFETHVLQTDLSREIEARR